MKKIGFLTLLIMAMFLLALAFPVAAAGPKAPAVRPQWRQQRRLRPLRRCHLILTSMKHWRRCDAAKHHLETAVPEFHGHRTKAIEHLDHGHPRS